MNNSDNNNNNFFNGVDNLNNNPTPNQMPSASNNNMNAMATQQSNTNPVNQFSAQTVNPTNSSQTNNLNFIPQNNNVGSVPQSSFQGNNVNPVMQQNSNASSMSQSSFQNNNVNPVMQQNSNASSMSQSSFQNNNVNPMMQQNSNGGSISQSGFQGNNVNSMMQQNSNAGSMPQGGFQGNNVNPVMQQNSNAGSMSQSNFQGNNINPMMQQSIGSINQSTVNSTSSIGDEELLRAFIGNNYEKITSKLFNFAGFFFTSLYMFYRKMFLYSILLFIVNLVVLNVVNNFIVTLLFNVLVGFFVNKVYLYYAKNKINKIKLQNPQRDVNELKGICSAKGGTSVGKLFLGLVTEIGIACIVVIAMAIAGIGGMLGSLFNLDDWNITIIKDKTNDDDQTDSTSTKDATLMKNVIVRGYSCSGSECIVYIEESNENVDYVFAANNVDLFLLLNDYNDYVNVDIYYTQKDSEKTIVDYKIYLKSNNEEITNIKTEAELRTKLGLYSVGIHTDSFTLSEIGMTGAGFKDDTSYTYTDYTFLDNENNEYEMRYIHSNGTINLVEGNKYTVTFEVAEDIFGYEFYIKSVN